jgi:hypothetical protein
MLVVLKEISTFEINVKTLFMKDLNSILKGSDDGG